MKQVAVFASERRSNAIHKEDLIYSSISAAFEGMADVASVRHGLCEAAPSASLPGLAEVRSHEAIVALGHAAHTVLADYRKQTLVAGAEDELLAEDVEIERLIWSCVNTLKIVALGRRAWRSIQMLPVSNRRFYDLPPLRIPGGDNRRSDEIGNEILIINHEDDDACARQLAEALFLEGYLVQRTGLKAGCDGDEFDDGGWATSAAVHVHVGCHDGTVEEVRLLDTWHSRRYAITYLPRRLMKAPPAGGLAVEAEVNGFHCDTIDKVFAACADIRADGVLRKKMLNAGAASVRPLTPAWTTIAADLIG